jgi:hypothetical protein
MRMSANRETNDAAVKRRRENGFLMRHAWNTQGQRIAGIVRGLPCFHGRENVRYGPSLKCQGDSRLFIFRFLQYIFACKHKKMPVIERKPECFVPKRLPWQTAKVAEVEEFPRRGWRSEFTLALPQTDSRAHEPSAGALVWWDHLQYSGASAR